jgi:hypothetical protein
MRAVAITEGVPRAGLAAALLVSQGMAAWIRGWRACTPPPRPAQAPPRATPIPDLVGVLAAMALACR